MINFNLSTKKFVSPNSISFSVLDNRKYQKQINYALNRGMNWYEIEFDFICSHNLLPINAYNLAEYFGFGILSNAMVFYEPEYKQLYDDYNYAIEFFMYNLDGYKNQKRKNVFNNVTDLFEVSDIEYCQELYLTNLTNSGKLNLSKAIKQAQKI